MRAPRRLIVPARWGVTIGTRSARVSFSTLRAVPDRLRAIGRRACLRLRQRDLLALLDLGDRRVGGREIGFGNPAPAEQEQQRQHHRQDHVSTVVHLGFPFLGHWIMAGTPPGVAAEQAPGGEPTPAERAIAGKRGDCIGRAAGLESAARRQDSRGPELPAAGDEDQQLRDHLATLARARRKSVSSSAKGRSIPV